MIVLSVVMYYASASFCSLKPIWHPVHDCAIVYHLHTSQHTLVASTFMQCCHSTGQDGHSTIQLQAEEEVEVGEDAMLEGAPAPPARQQSPLQFMGKAYRGQSTVPYRAAFQMAAPDQQTEDVMGNEAEDDHVSFAPVFEEEEQGMPAMFVPVVKGGAQQTGQHLGWQICTTLELQVRQDIVCISCFGLLPLKAPIMIAAEH